jgi:hypothetical protein
MRSKNLNKLLNQLDLIENKAIFFRNEEDGEVFSGFSADINKKLELIKPDAFFVFNNQPFVLFFDLASIDDERKENEIHKQVWSFDNSPIVFIIKDVEIKVYNALNFEKQKGLEEIKLSETERNKKFSFWNLQSGEAFKWFYEEHKNTVLKKRVNQQLFENIKQTILILKNDFELKESLAKILVLRLIFIRYLIDRKIKIDTSFISGHEENIIKRRRSLSELIANPKKLIAFFDYLNTRFNGVLFKDSNIELSSNQANILSKLFNPDGVSVEDQISLFSHFDFQYDVFDFGIIPVELISGIYETLLDEETKNATSAVYTPPFLVDYILNQTVDEFFRENRSISECKIFDPAMGSGIFLVQGLRRMIEQEKKLNPNDDNLTFGTKIKEIAERNLFGIDINEEAINVACFSIYVALLDYQEPGNIDVYRFPNLKGKNFFKAHFFDLTKKDVWHKIKKENVNFILGNPPWKSNNSPEHLIWLKHTKFDKIVSDKQIAQSYLIRIKDFVRDESKIALIVTSKVFYNNQAKKFKTYFLENNIVSEIFDLSSVRHLVFENADNPGTVIFFKYKLPQINYSFGNIVKHVSLKQNRFFSKFSKNLIFEKFDVKSLLQSHYLNNQWLFKVSLYGNTLDYVLLNRLNNYSTIGSVFKKNKIKFSKGVFRGTPKKYYTELIDLPIIRRKEFNRIITTYRSDFNKIKYESSFLEAGRTIDLFQGKKIILQKSVSVDFKFSLVEFDCVFDSTVYGINFKKDNDLIYVFTSLLLSDLYVYYQYLTSSSWGIYIPEIYKEEHINFPYIEPNESQKNKIILLIDNLLKPYKEFYKEYPDSIFQGDPSKEILDEINAVIEEIYQITGYEQDLIDYVLNVSRYQFQESKQHLVSDFNNDDHRNKKLVLERYADVFVQEFEKIYDNEYIQVEIYSLDYFIAMNFVFLNEKPSEKIIFPDKKTEKEVLNSLANSLSISQITDAKNSEQNLFIQKDIKGFEKNSFYIIKPPEYKCWHRAIAWYDIAEFKEAIEQSELNELNHNFDGF